MRPPAKQRALDPLGRGEVADVLHHGGVYPPRRPRVGRQHRPTRGWEVAEGRPAADGGDPEGADGGEGLEEISTGDLGVYACAVGGDDGRTLFLCAAPSFAEHERRDTRDGVLLTARL